MSKSGTKPFKRGSWAQGRIPYSPSSTKNALGSFGIPLKRSTSGSRQKTKPCLSIWKPGGTVLWDSRSVILSYVTWTLCFSSSHVQWPWPSAHKTQDTPDLNRVPTNRAGWSVSRPRSSTEVPSLWQHVTSIYTFWRFVIFVYRRSVIKCLSLTLLIYDTMAC